MNASLLHTPDGVRDIYGRELMEKEQVGKNLMTVLRRYGYRNIQTPTFEFFDVFSKDIGTIPSKDLYKFFDKEGNTLVLRPDFTPAIARCAAKYFMEEEVPLRFCYEGNAFANTSELQGKLKETTQMGIELINDSGVEADAEALSLVIEGLKKCGLNDFQISIGNNSYFKGICEAANLDEETQLQIKAHISSKNYFGLSEFLRSKGLDTAIIDNFEAISKLYISDADMEKMKEKAPSKKAAGAIERLQATKAILAKRGLDKYISFDLGMLSKYNYYTGIIFKAYTYGVGDAIVKGGRYDGLLGKFGKEAPSVGCVFLIDELYTALKRQKIALSVDAEENIVVLYEENCYDKAMNVAEECRNNGKNVAMMKKSAEKDTDTYVAYAKENDNAELIVVTATESKHISL